MDFKEALQKSLKAQPNALADSFLLYSCVSDLVGNDYEAKKAAEQFYRLDETYQISKSIRETIPMPKKRKKRIYRIKPIAPPAEDAYVFYDTNTETVHSLEQCPRITDLRARHVIYAKAKQLDYSGKHTDIPWWSPALKHAAQSHNPKICRQCGDFRPIHVPGFKERFRSFLHDTVGLRFQIRRIGKF